MIPGSPRQTGRAEFRRGIVCGRLGCSRRARHEWAYPCAVTTMEADPRPPRWLPVCDVALNDVLLRAVGVPDDLRATLLDAYRLVQADLAFT